MPSAGARPSTRLVGRADSRPLTWPNSTTAWRNGSRRCEVVCTAIGADGSNAVSRSETFDPVGWTRGFTPADLAKLDDCMAERFQEVRGGLHGDRGRRVQCRQPERDLRPGWLDARIHAR